MPSEEVEDEILALESIYENQFSRTGDNQIRAIVRPEEESEGPSKLEGTSVLYIEADLPQSYPSEAIPNFSLSNINNNHLNAQTKESILHGLVEQCLRICPKSLGDIGCPSSIPVVTLGSRTKKDPKMQAQEQLGTCSLYTVIEWAREQLPEWLAASATAARESLQESPAKAEPCQPIEAKTQEDEGFNTKGMSKGQKRRHFDRFGVAAEKPRGHDWVDLVSHLAKR